MATRSRVTDTGDDQVTVKAHVPRSLWVIIKRFAIEVGVTPIQAWAIFLNRITKEIETGNHAFTGSDFSSVIRGLKLTNQLGADGLPPIDFGKLERSDKSKTGFAGVYVTKDGYRAEGKQPGGGSGYIAMMPNAEQAAWARYLHYQKHGIPYGEVEDRLKEFKAIVAGYRACYPSSEQAQTDDDFLVSMLSLSEVEELTRIACEVGVKFGPIDGTKKITAPLFEPFRGDGTDEPSIAGSPLPLTDGRRQWAVKEITHADQAKIDQATGAVK